MRAGAKGESRDPDSTGICTRCRQPVNLYCVIYSSCSQPVCVDTTAYISPSGVLRGNCTHRNSPHTGQVLEYHILSSSEPGSLVNETLAPIHLVPYTTIDGVAATRSP
jgi:hypothetical protein